MPKRSFRKCSKSLRPTANITKKHRISCEIIWSNMRLKAFAAQTHQGPYLQVNEDGYDFDFENELFFILDGFGGSGIGDRTVEKLKQEIKSYYTQISDDPNATMPLYYNPRNLLEGNAILNSMMNAHQN